MEYATIVIIGIGVILIGIFITAQILHNNVNEQELKEFEENLLKAKYATCEYIYENPFIPVLKDIYIVKEIKNGDFNELIEALMQKPIEEMKELYNNREIEK